MLSNGHGSMLIYSLLHLTGYDLPMEELKNFRQLHSKTPGHPEYGYAPGVETTTGPLGQGITNAVGMALAEKVLAGQFNRDGHHIVDHYTYVFLGDGCLMEGISHEACSLAGTLGLGKLIAFYDDNGISIDGHVEGWFTDNTPKRFEAYGWHVVRDVDGHDPDAIRKAIWRRARSTTSRRMICCKTMIGYGAPNQCGTHDCHGAPLGDDEIKATRENLGWKHEPFEIPKEIYAGWDAKSKGAAAEKHWNDKFAAYKKAYPELAAEFERRMIKGELPTDWAAKADEFIKSVDAKAETIASRKASQNALNGYGPLLPELLGGSADLAGSNLTIWKGSKGVSNTVSDGNYIYYGVREFGMSAIMNGIALHGGFIPYGATFLMFSEYARNALRMAALMKIPIDLRLHPRLHRSRRRRPDAPAGRADRDAAPHPEHVGLAPVRCGGIRGGLEGRHRAQARPVVPDLLAPESAAPEARRPAARGHRPRRLRAVRGRRRQAAGHDHRHRLRGRHRRGGAEAARRQGQEGARGVDAVHRYVRRPGRRLPRERAAQGREARGGRGRRDRRAGTSTSAWTARVVGLDRFGESAPAGALFKQFGFTGENVAKAVEEIL